MKNMIKLFRFIALATIIGFSFAACGGDDGGGGGDGDGSGGGGVWLQYRYISYNVKDGVASVSGGVGSITWLRYNSETDWEYTIGTSVSGIRNGQTEVIKLGNVQTTTSLIDLSTGLTLKETSISTISSSERVFTLELLSDVGGVKTYKYYLSSSIDNNVNGNISNLGYSEYKFKNSKRLEQKKYTAEGVLESITTFNYPDNAIIRAKLPDFSFSTTIDYPSQPIKNVYSTIEILSNSDSELAIRLNLFNADNVLTGYMDQYFKPKSALLQQ